MFNNLFGKFSKEIDSRYDDITRLASDADGMDLQNEEQVRALIASVASMIGKKIDPELEEQLVEMILSGDVPTDMGQLMKMLM